MAFGVGMMIASFALACDEVIPDVRWRALVSFVVMIIGCFIVDHISDKQNERIEKLERSLQEAKNEENTVQ